ncbi:hypothetical protein ACFPRL_28425 [Pseudoclavibacter helvolus]
MPGMNSCTCRPDSSRPRGVGASTPAFRRKVTNSTTPAVDALHRFRTVSPTRTTSPPTLPPSRCSASSISRG